MNMKKRRDMQLAYISDEAVMEEQRIGRKILQKLNFADRSDFDGIAEIVKEHPEIYDYYIKMREEEKEEIKKECIEEVDIQIDKFINNAKELINIYQKSKHEIYESSSAYEESKNRMKFFKHIREDCDGYRNLYYKGERISTENDLQRMFKFVWCRTAFKPDFETNNGRGPADVVVS